MSCVAGVTFLAVGLGHTELNTQITLTLGLNSLFLSLFFKFFFYLFLFCCYFVYYYYYFVLVGRQEGHFYLKTHSTHFILRLYGIRHMG